MSDNRQNVTTDRISTYALAINFLDLGRFLAGCACEKSSNCVSPKNINERLDRVADLPETLTQQIAYLSELLVTNGQQAAQRDASLNAKLDRLSEAIASLVDHTQQRTAAIDDRLDRIATTLEARTKR